MSGSILGYGFLLYCLPAIANSAYMQSKYSEFLSSKLKMPVKIQGFAFHSNPNMTFDLNVNEISAHAGSVRNIKLTSKFLSPKPKVVNIDSVYLDVNCLKKVLGNTKKNSKPLKITYFPLLNVKKVYLKLDDIGSYADFENIKSYKDNSKIVCELPGKIIASKYLENPVYIGKSGRLYYSNDLYFDKFYIGAKNSIVYLDGSLNKFSIKGEKISVNELEKAFLYFYKFKHPGKRNFIENFENFDGTIDVNLVYDKHFLIGKCIAHNLQADFSKYKIPIMLPYVVFNFDKSKMTAATIGTFGGEKVYTDVKVEGLFTKSVETVGSVRANLTDKFSNKYFKPIKIIKSAVAGVKYHVHNGVSDIDYVLTVPKGSDVVSNFGRLENSDKVRQILAKTSKQSNDLVIKQYSYSFISNKEKREIFKGNGLFSKINGRLKPQYIVLKTVERTPVSVLSGFLNNFLYDGTYTADLRYDFNNSVASGKLNLYDVYHEDFMYLKNAAITASDEFLKFDANGTFFNSPIMASLVADNNFQNGLNIENIDIHLDKYYIKRGNIQVLKSAYTPKDGFKTHKHKDYNLTVKKGKVVVDDILNPKFHLHKVSIVGSLKDNIVDFVIPETGYAQGILCAYGKYNVKKHSSNIHFLASGIDSNEVATKIFNLPNQFEGKGFASLHLITKNKLNDIYAKASFAIEDGFLPKLGSREFIINKSKKRNGLLAHIKKPIKFTLSKISNIDFSKPNIFYSDLRGSFILDNEHVHDVRIYSQSDYLSMFIEGDYNIDSEIGKLSLWGRHNKIAEKKIRILKLPLSLLYKIFFKVERSKDKYIDKINKIPKIQAKPSEEGLFRVNIDGNLNSNDIKVILKDIK